VAHVGNDGNATVDDHCGVGVPQFQEEAEGYCVSDGDSDEGYVPGVPDQL
jgi:hypothetical protein